MNKKEIEALARKAARDLKTEADATRLNSTFRNGHSSKPLKTGEDELVLDTPRR